jgi:hypothetical protein
MNNILYQGIIKSAKECPGGEEPDEIVLTEESNGFAIWRCNYDERTLLDFMRFTKYTAIEKAVRLTLEARAEWEREKAKAAA